MFFSQHEVKTGHVSLSKCKSQDAPVSDNATCNETLEVPIQMLVSDANEIETIHVGDLSNISSETHNQVIESTFIASRDALGICHVTVERPQVENKTFSTRFKPFTVAKPSQVRKGSFHVKRHCIIRNGRSRMITDARKNIPVEVFKAQLKNTDDIIGDLEIAPSTKQFLQILNTTGVNKLFASPGRVMSYSLQQIFTRHLTAIQVKAAPILNDEMELKPIIGTMNIDDQSTISSKQRNKPEAKDDQKKLPRMLPQVKLKRLSPNRNAMSTGVLPDINKVLEVHHENHTVKDENNLELAYDDTLCPPLENKISITMVEGEQQSDLVKMETLSPSTEILLPAEENPG